MESIFSNLSVAQERVQKAKGSLNREVVITPNQTYLSAYTGTTTNQPITNGKINFSITQQRHNEQYNDINVYLHDREWQDPDTLLTNYQFVNVELNNKGKEMSLVEVGLNEGFSPWINENGYNRDGLVVNGAVTPELAKYLNTVLDQYKLGDWIDIDGLNGKAEASIGEGGLTVGASASLGTIKSKDFGELSPNNSLDRTGNISVEAGAGFMGDIIVTDEDGDGIYEIGVGGDILMFHVEGKTEDYLGDIIRYNPMSPPGGNIIAQELLDDVNVTQEAIEVVDKTVEGVKQAANWVGNTYTSAVVLKDEMVETTIDITNEVITVVGEKKEELIEKSEQLLDKAIDLKEQAIEKGEEVISDIKDKADDIKEQVVEKGEAIVGDIRDKADDLKDKAIEKSEDLLEGLAEKGEKAKDKANETMNYLLNLIG